GLRIDRRARGPLRRLHSAERHRENPHHRAGQRASSRADRPAGRRAMSRTVAQALDDAAAGPGAFVFVGPDGREAVQPFKVLRDTALDLGGALRARGLDPGDYVAIIIPDADGFLTTFMGASAAGLVPMPLAHPYDVTQLEAYFDTVVPLFRLARARAGVTTPRLYPLLEGLPAAASTIRFVTSWTELTGPALPKSEQVDLDAPA